MVLLAFLYCGFRLAFHTMFTTSFLMEGRNEEAAFEGIQAAVWVPPTLICAYTLRLRFKE